MVGVGQVSLFLRYARSLKDKRQAISGIKKKLSNLGFSVTECAFADIPKQASIGFAYAGREPAAVKQLLDQALRLFIGEWEIVSQNTDVFDYSFDKESEFSKSFEDDPENRT